MFLRWLRTFVLMVDMEIYTVISDIYIVTHMSSKFQDELSYLIIFEIYPSADSEIIADNIKKFW